MAFKSPAVALPDGGVEDLKAAHALPGVLHIAVSVQLLTADGQWLLQRRSRAKAIFAGRWANSCCTHPAPGELLADAARRRVRDELGLTPSDLIAAGDFRYRALDPDSGLVEHEHDHVFVGQCTGVPATDASEVEEVWYGPFSDALARVRGGDGAPWAESVLRMCAVRLGSVEALL